VTSTLKKILILEPYFGGSHKAFLQGLASTLSAEWTFLTLPARKWKMRMQLSAYWFADQIQKLCTTKREQFDVVLCSTFVDTAVLRSLLTSKPWWNPTTPIHIYFHENQFGYPNQIADPQIYQFTAINYNSAMAANSLGFNSNYNLQGFLGGISVYLKKASDMKLSGTVEEVRKKSCILFPGFDYSLIDKTRKNRPASNGPPVIVWNHRWEHDKGPEIFFAALDQIRKEKIPFKLIVLGQSFDKRPECFERAKERLKDNILHFGYVKSRREYVRLLCQGDIVVSTAQHEFFGISIIEAVRAGCYPVLPDRLSYTELFDSSYRYKDQQFSRHLSQLLRYPQKMDYITSNRLTDRFKWSELKNSYDKWFSLSGDRIE